MGDIPERGDVALLFRQQLDAVGVSSDAACRRPRRHNADIVPSAIRR